MQKALLRHHHAVVDRLGVSGRGERGHEDDRAAHPHAFLSPVGQTGSGAQEQHPCRTHEDGRVRGRCLGSARVCGGMPRGRARGAGRNPAVSPFPLRGDRTRYCGCSATHVDVELVGIRLGEAGEPLGLGDDLLSRPGGEGGEGRDGDSGRCLLPARASRCRPRSRRRARWRRVARRRGRPAGGHRRATNRSSRAGRDQVVVLGDEATGAGTSASGRGALGEVE